EREHYSPRRTEQGSNHNSPSPAPFYAVLPRALYPESYLRWGRIGLICRRRWKIYGRVAQRLHITGVVLADLCNLQPAEASLGPPEKPKALQTGMPPVASLA